MALQNADSIKKSTEQTVSFLDWLVDLIQRRSWVKLIILFDITIIVFLNPLTSSFLKDDLKQYLPENYFFYWLFTVIALLLLAFSIAYITRPKTTQPRLKLSERSVIKGLVAFGSEDVELFEQLGRNRSIRHVLNSLNEPSFRFGILTGESGCGKSSFLQAGIIPRLETIQHQGIYVQCDESHPIDSIRVNIHKQFNIPYDQLHKLDFGALLDLVVERIQQEEQPKTLILVLDQFEQFFTHQRFKDDRKSFNESLSTWYQQHPPHPVKILVALRSDLAGKMVELQNIMGYTLGPNQNFMLEKFEPDEAAHVFRTIIQHENIQYDENFIKELCATELANPLDGLISPVDLQILAFMIAGQDSSIQTTFDRTIFQRMGGLEGLLNNFLDDILKSRFTIELRQTALKVLLALIDLDNVLRAGVLTEVELQQKLVGSLSKNEVSEALKWLIRPDVRLVTPRSKGEIEGYELAHEHIIPSIRHLAGQTLTGVDKANQLLQRRVNEWLGNNHSSRYLLRWHELRQVLKQKTYLNWEPRGAQKIELIHRSRRRYQYVMMGITGLLVLFLSGYSLSFLPSVQIWQVKQELITLLEKPRQDELLRQSSLAFLITGDIKIAIATANKMNNSNTKEETIKALAESTLKLNNPDQAIPLLGEIIAAAKLIDDSEAKANTLKALADSALKLNKPDQTIILIEEALTEAKLIDEDVDDARTKVKTLIALADSALKLNNSDQAIPLLGEIIAAAKLIDDSEAKAYILNDLADSMLKLNNPEQTITLLGEAITEAKLIDIGGAQAKTLIALADSTLKLNKPDQAIPLLGEIIVAAKLIYDARTKANTLNALADSTLKLNNPDQAIPLLGEIIDAAKLIDDSEAKAYILNDLADSALKLNKPDQAIILIDEAITAAELIDYASDKAVTLKALADSALKLNNPDQAIILIDKAIKAASQIVNERVKADILEALADSTLKLNNPDQAIPLLRKMSKVAMMIDSFFHAETIANILIVLADRALELDKPELTITLLGEARTYVNWLSGPDKVNILIALAESTLKLNNPEQAIPLLGKLIASAKKIKDSKAKADTLIALADSSLKLNNPEQTTTLLGEAITEAKLIDSAKAQADTLFAWADSALKLNNPEQTITLLVETFVAKWKDDASEKAIILKTLADRAQELNKPDLTVTLIDKAITATNLIDSAWDKKANTLVALADSVLKLNKPDQAIILIDEAITAAELIDYASDKAVTLKALADRALKLNNPDQAIILIDKAIKAASQIVNDRVKAHILEALADSALKLNNPDQAIILIDKAKKAASQIVNDRVKAHILEALADSALKLNKSDQAIILIDEAITAAKLIDDSEAKAYILNDLADSALKLNKPDQAVNLLDKIRITAITIINDIDLNNLDAFFLKILSNPEYPLPKTQNLNKLILLAEDIIETDKRNYTMVELSKLAAKNGNWSQAKSTEDRISSESYKIKAFSFILEAYADK